MLSDGFRPDPEKVSAVTTLKDSAPKTVGEAGKLHGLIRYYQRSIIILLGLLDRFLACCRSIF